VPSGLILACGSPLIKQKNYGAITIELLQIKARAQTPKAKQARAFIYSCLFCKA
jgi:hypothetical protein